MPAIRTRGTKGSGAVISSVSRCPPASRARKNKLGHQHALIGSGVIIVWKTRGPPSASLINCDRPWAPWGNSRSGGRQVYPILSALLYMYC